MTNEQCELDRLFICSIDVLSRHIAYLRRTTPATKELTIAEMLENARDVFSRVHKQWRDHLGEPAHVKPEVINRLLAERLQQLADQLREDAQ